MSKDIIKYIALEQLKKMSLSDNQKRVIASYEDRDNLALVASWKTRIYTNGFKIKDVLLKTGFSPVTFSLWVNFVKKPKDKNLKKIEACMNEMGI